MICGERRIMVAMTTEMWFFLAQQHWSRFSCSWQCYNLSYSILVSFVIWFITEIAAVGLTWQQCNACISWNTFCISMCIADPSGCVCLINYEVRKTKTCCKQELLLQDDMHVDSMGDKLSQLKFIMHTQSSQH